MGVQILGLRDYFDSRVGKTRKKETFFEKKWRAKSVKELFDNMAEIVGKIPVEERINLYYTAASCVEKEGRILEYQDILPIDIDNIDLDKIEEYIPPVLEVIGRTREQVAIVATGNGLQIIIGLEEGIDDEDYFDQERVYYKAMCTQITKGLKLLGLEGDVDSSVFSKGRLLRLPLTINKKPIKGERPAKLITSNIDQLPFNLREISGIPEVKMDEQVSERVLEHLPPPDAEGVQAGCDFLKWCKDNQNKVSEPQWYAMLSIIGRLENGKQLAHEYSNQYDSYNEFEVNSKLHQALESSGPRTCDSIYSMWDECEGCNNFLKCKSPIMLQSKEYIKTKETGFYNVTLDTNGLPKKGKPNHDDLMQYFEQKTPFITLDESTMTMVYNNKHWEYFSKGKLDAFAEDNFDPKPTNVICAEFRGKLIRNHIVDLDYFKSPNLINFSNGTLNLDTMVLDKHKPSDRLKYVLPFDYSPAAECPRFDQFLSEVTCGKDELTVVLLEYMGYSLSGVDPSIGQKALILEGDGSNGKSVFMDVLKYLAGKDNYSALSMGNEISKLENRYQLDGKLFNISEETPTNAMMDSTVFKAIVTGGEVQARRLYCNAYSMRNTAKIIMACNELPTIKDSSHGMFRRLLVVPFRAVFSSSTEGYDPFIRDKLYAEAPGIMNRVMEGLIRFKDKKMFSDSKIIQAGLDEYREENDSIMQWFFENVEKTDDDTTVSLLAFYNMYKLDMEEIGEKPKTINMFGKRVKSLLHDPSVLRKYRIDGGSRRGLRGYKVIERGGAY